MPYSQVARGDRKGHNVKTTRHPSTTRRVRLYAVSGCKPHPGGQLVGAPIFTVRQATRTCWDVIRADGTNERKARRIVSTHATKDDAVKAASVMTNDAAAGAPPTDIDGTPTVFKACGLSEAMHNAHGLACCKDPSSDKHSFTIDGHTIDCYGDMAEDMNVEVICADPEFDGVWCNDDECKTWAAVIASLLPWAKRNGTTLEQLTAV